LENSHQKTRQLFILSFPNRSNGRIFQNNKSSQQFLIPDTFSARKYFSHRSVCFQLQFYALKPIERRDFPPSPRTQLVCEFSLPETKTGKYRKTQFFLARALLCLLMNPENSQKFVFPLVLESVQAVLFELY
jgi:hypothetical protein